MTSSSSAPASPARWLPASWQTRNVRMIDQGSSELSIIVGVDDQDFEKTIQAIYSAFVN